MSLSLPPKSLIRCDAPTAKYVHEQLTSVITGHPQATTTYRFYEEVDAWLGPWGARGYPLAYGKFYNVLFSTNENLRANPTARDWVWRTTILLQEALRDYLVERVRDGSIRTLTEAQLRQAAFDSHPRAYDLGGLARVAMAAPELMVIIAAIPRVEFLPTSENFRPTVRQVFITLGLVGPKVVGSGMAALAGPAHTGILHRAVQLDRQGLSDERAIARELTSIKAMLNRGDLDYLPLLDLVIARLNGREFPDEGFARAAREVVENAQTRRLRLVRNYNLQLQQSPEVRARVDQIFPGILRSVEPQPR